MRIPARDARAHVPGKGLQDRDAGGDVPDVDFEDARHGVGHTDPGQIVGFHLPGSRGARDGDGAGDDAEAHEGAEGDFEAGFYVQGAEEEDGEGGEEEVGEEGEDALRDEDVHDGCGGEAGAGEGEVPGFGDGAALEGDEEEER